MGSGRRSARGGTRGEGRRALGREGERARLTTPKLQVGEKEERRTGQKMKKVEGNKWEAK